MKLSIVKSFLLSGILFSQMTFAAEQNTTLDIQNMTCAMCPITVKKSLTNVKGVTEVNISFENKTADVDYDDALTDVEKLISATTNVGYPSTVHKADSDGERK